jgi:hypothetical protein
MNIGNQALKNDMRLMKDKSNIVGISTRESEDSGAMIEIEEKEPKAVSTYLYTNKDDRDTDFALLENLIK